MASDRRERAFGWPRGTVRGMLAFFVVGVGILVQAGLVAGLVLGRQFPEAIAVASGMMVQAAAVLGWYFGTQGSSGSVELQAILDLLDARQPPRAVLDDFPDFEPEPTAPGPPPDD